MSILVSMKIISFYTGYTLLTLDGINDKLPSMGVLGLCRLTNGPETMKLPLPFLATLEENYEQLYKRL